MREIGGKLIYVTAEPKKRWERGTIRKEKADDDVSFEKFLELGRAEAELQILAIGADADFKIENNGPKEDFYLELEKTIEAV